MRPSSQKILVDAGLAVLLVALVVAIPLVYVGREQFFYAWDFRGYQQTAINQVQNLLASPASLLRAAMVSLGEDYNALYTLPLAPLMTILGRPETRTTYIVSLGLAYYVAYAVLIGAVFARMARQRQRAAFWTGAFAAVILPYAWIPTLRGYPDTGGAIAIALAALVYLTDPRLRRWWQIVAIGVFLALAILFRRHFGYAATSFLVTMALMALFRFTTSFKNDHKTAWRGLAADSLRVGLTMLFVVFALLILGYPFVTHVLSQNFLALYRSYEISLATLISYYRSYYGWAAIIVAIAGLAIGLHRRVLKAEAVLFVALLALVGFAQWGWIVRQVNPHYSLHFTFIFLLGISTAAWLILFFMKGLGRLAGVAILAGSLLVGGLSWFGVAGLARGPVVQALLPQDIQPLRRADYPEISRLVKYLRSKTTADQTIFVVDSSAQINADLLSSADQALFPQGARLNILTSPQVDSRDQYPLQALLAADFVVISRPLQRHLAFDEQGVISSIYDLFAAQAEITEDFSRLPVEFNLAGGIQTELFKRIQETSPDVALRALQHIQAAVGSRPGGQADWLPVTRFASMAIESIADGYRLSGSLNIDRPEATFLNLGPLPENGTIAGSLQSAPGCPDIQMKILLANGAGQTSLLVERQFSTGKDDPFTANFSSPGWPYLLIQLTPASAWVGAEVCSTSVNVKLSGN